MVANVYMYVKPHATPGQVEPRTLPGPLDAFDVQVGGAPHAVPAIQESQVRSPPIATHVGYESAIFALSEWVKISRLRSALQEGHGSRNAVADSVSHLAHLLAATHADSCPLSFATKAGQVGSSAWLVSASFYCRLNEVSGL